MMSNTYEPCVCVKPREKETGGRQSQKRKPPEGSGCTIPCKRSFVNSCYYYYYLASQSDSIVVIQTTIVLADLLALSWRWDDAS
jgi:hypothetical protein